jgi:hypothetical protein
VGRGPKRRRAPRAGSARRRRSLEPEDGDPPYAQRSGALCCGGVCGGSCPCMTNVAWQPSARRGQPGAAALTGPPTAALTGRAASRAERRWRHTAKSPGGRMGEARRSDRLSALPSPRGVIKQPPAASGSRRRRLEREHGDQRPLFRYENPVNFSNRGRPRRRSAPAVQDRKKLKYYGLECGRLGRRPLRILPALLASFI